MRSLASLDTWMTIWLGDYMVAYHELYALVGTLVNGPANQESG